MHPEEAMALAIELSRSGFPAPNPHVGCVLIKNCKVVGAGFHDHAGGPHAEVVALAEAGPEANGAAAYVTLEPCNHHGRTGPCSQALIAAGVSEVVVAVPDPNPVAAGGEEVLRSAGVKYSSGLLNQEATEANLWWLTSQRRKRPFVVAKVAMSLDGNIALASGESKWITGKAAREAGQRLRAMAGAVLVGKRTVVEDDPTLTARIPGVINQPTRIVLDRKGELNRSLNIFNGDAPTLQVVEKAESSGQVKVLVREEGFDLLLLLERLFTLGHTSLLIEGGAATLGAFMQEGLVDELHLFVAPKVLVGGKSWAAGNAASQLPQIADWQFHRLMMAGGDAELVLRPAVVQL